MDDTPKTADDDKLIYHIADHLNSSSLDLSSTGVLIQATDYLPFGKSNTYEVTSKRVKGKKWWYTNKYKFANKQQDDETDLQYFEKRYYDNRIWRFTTEDPVYWEVGRTKRPDSYFTDPQSWNTYSYTRNNPVNLVDPTWEVWDTIWDVANMAYDAAKIAKNGLEMAYEWARNAYGTITGNQQLVQDSQQAWQQDKKELWEWVIDAWVDTIAAAIPFVPAGGSKLARAWREATELAIKQQAKKELAWKIIQQVNKWKIDWKIIMEPWKIKDTQFSRKAWDWVKKAYNYTDKKGTTVEIHWMEQISVKWRAKQGARDQIKSKD